MMFDDEEKEKKVEVESPEKRAYNKKPKVGSRAFLSAVSCDRYLKIAFARHCEISGIVGEQKTTEDWQDVFDQFTGRGKK
jgi:hypothetical protein